MKEAPKQDPWRFSLGTLMIGVAIVAVTLGVLRKMGGLDARFVAQVMIDVTRTGGQIALCALPVALPFFLYDRLVIRPAAARYDRRLWELNQGIDRWKDEDR